MTTFEPFPKIKRLSRECIITEKLDGTNASVVIQTFDDAHKDPPSPDIVAITGCFVLYAGSRNRFVTPGKSTDNFGFAAWVRDNAEELVALGVGHHFGEWWGSGIQRGYGLKDRRFSLFNVSRWADERPSCCSVVPVLYRGLFDTAKVDACVERLRVCGSFAAPGFMQPEGVIVYHTAAQTRFKKTLDGDAHKEAA